MNRFNRVTSLLSLLLYALTVNSLSASELPKEDKFEDYGVIIKNSPFAPLTQSKKVETVVATPKPKIVNWELKGATKMADGWFVVVADKKAPGTNITLREDRENPNGLKIIRVDLKPDAYKESIVVLLDKDHGEVEVKFSTNSQWGGSKPATAGKTMPKPNPTGNTQSTQRNPTPSSNVQSPRPSSSSSKPSSSSSKPRRPIIRRVTK
ncbi:hypothetical protein OAB00_00650 [Akkermansiaceae bacterium]|nr:hypothetical protein [Akkermansiaceae bacterium]